MQKRQERVRHMLNSINNLQKEEQHDSLDKLLAHMAIGDLIENIDKFKLDEENLKDLLSMAIESNYGYSVINNIEKFNLNEYDRFKLAQELVVPYGDILIRNIEKFKLNNRDYKIFLAKGLLERQNYGYSLIDNIKKLELNKDDLKNILDMAVKLNYGYSVIDNVQNFGLNEEERFCLASSLSENFSKRLIENIDKFSISSVEKKFRLAKMLIKGNGYDIIKNIKKFNFDTENTCKILQEFLLLGENYLLFVDKLTELFMNCKKDSIIYVNKLFNLILFQEKYIRLKHINLNGDEFFFKELIDLYYDNFEFDDKVLGDKIYCDKAMFDKTIRNLRTLDDFQGDINFDMDKILGKDNADIVNGALEKIMVYDTRRE